ncbi:MAG: hypothetical protein PWR13_1415 [Archaeoglobi archaeon]|nr:hypothetical protein [Candidatus Mnemosynella bozhongmuii]MDI3502585.1 hypothetical protein [Archaeoglobi archaeon]MDK2782387.1 hypothetical protein [Archaeoglobi archaeon]
MHTIEAVIASALILTSLYFLMTHEPYFSFPSHETPEEQLRDYGISSLNALEARYGMNESSLNFLQRCILRWNDGGKEEFEETLRELLPENIRFDVFLIFISADGNITVAEGIDSGVPRDAVVVEKTIFLRDGIAENPVLINEHELRNLEGRFYSPVILRLVLWYA